MTNSTIKTLPVCDLPVGETIMETIAHTIAMLEERMVFVNKVTALDDVPVSFMYYGLLVIDETSLSESIALHDLAQIEFDTVGYAERIVEAITSNVIDGRNYRGVIDHDSAIDTSLVQVFKDAVKAFRRAARDLDALGRPVHTLAIVDTLDACEVINDSGIVSFSDQLITNVLDNSTVGNRVTKLSDAIVTLSLREHMMAQ